MPANAASTTRSRDGFYAASTNGADRVVTTVAGRSPVSSTVMQSHSRSIGRSITNSAIGLILVFGASAALAVDPIAPTNSTERGAAALDALRRHLQLPIDERPSLADADFALVPLRRAEATAAADLLFEAHLERVAAETRDAWRDGRVDLGPDTMRFLIRRFGDAPTGRRSLWISLHGGGGTPPEVNDQQWRNQIRLYEPTEGIVVAPRALQNTWDLWHEPRIDRFVARLIECAVALEGVDPDRVFLLGYSAGGDGLYRLGPRLADRLAAASMMAGHPGDADPRSLRNLPFSIQVGALDSAYERNQRAREWGERLAELQRADPGGYPHLVRIHDGLGHWMQRRDAFAIEWMSRHLRTPWPRRVVWHQHAVTHDRFYWLGVEGDDRRPKSTIIAETSGQVVALREADVAEVTLWLDDALIDLDQRVVVRHHDEILHDALVQRTIATLDESLSRRRDRRLMAPAVLRVRIPEVTHDESE